MNSKISLGLICVILLVLLGFAVYAIPNTIFSDFDGDGSLDIFLDVLIRNNASNFTIASAVDGIGNLTQNFTVYQGLFGDFNGDGNEDLYVVTNISNFLYINNGNGTFQNLTPSNIGGNTSSPNATAIFDFDGDGNLDLFANGRLFLGNGTGNFTDQTGRANLNLSDEVAPLKQVFLVDLNLHERIASSTNDSFLIEDGTNLTDLLGVSENGTIIYLQNLGDTNGDGVPEFFDATDFITLGLISNVNFISANNFFVGDNASGFINDFLDDLYISRTGLDFLFTQSTPVNASFAPTSTFPSFTQITGNSVLDAAATGDGRLSFFADFDNNTFPDLYIGKSGADVVLLRNGSSDVLNFVNDTNLSNSSLVNGTSKLAMLIDFTASIFPDLALIDDSVIGTAVTAGGLLTAGTSESGSNIVNVDAGDVYWGGNDVSTLTSESAPITSPTISVTKTASSGVVPNGTLVNYTINISNTGNDTALEINLSDTLPAGIIFVNGSPVTNATNNTWFLGNLSNGSSIIVNISGLVDATNTSTFRNNATTTFRLPNGSIENASGDVTITATVPTFTPSLSVTKTASSGVVENGSAVNYTINVSNVGNGTAVDVNLSDSLPSGLTFENASPAANSSNNSWQLGNISNGSSVIVNITGIVNITVTTSLLNNASVNFSLGNGSFDETSGDVTITGNIPSAPSALTPRGESRGHNRDSESKRPIFPGDRKYYYNLDPSLVPREKVPREISEGVPPTVYSLDIPTPKCEDKYITVEGSEGTYVQILVDGYYISGGIIDNTNNIFFNDPEKYICDEAKELLNIGSEAGVVVPHRMEIITKLPNDGNAIYASTSEYVQNNELFSNVYAWNFLFPEEKGFVDKIITDDGRTINGIYDEGKGLFMSNNVKDSTDVIAQEVICSYPNLVCIIEQFIERVTAPSNEIVVIGPGGDSVFEPVGKKLYKHVAGLIKPTISGELYLENVVCPVNLIKVDSTADKQFLYKLISKVDKGRCEEIREPPTICESDPYIISPTTKQKDDAIDRQKRTPVCSLPQQPSAVPGVPPVVYGIEPTVQVGAEAPCCCVAQYKEEGGYGVSRGWHGVSANGGVNGKWVSDASKCNANTVKALLENLKGDFDKTRVLCQQGITKDRCIEFEEFEVPGALKGRAGRGKGVPSAAEEGTKEVEMACCKRFDEKYDVKRQQFVRSVISLKWQSVDTCKGEGFVVDRSFAESQCDYLDYRYEGEPVGEVEKACCVKTDAKSKTVSYRWTDVNACGLGEFVDKRIPIDRCRPWYGETEGKLGCCMQKDNKKISFAQWMTEESCWSKGAKFKFNEKVSVEECKTNVGCCYAEGSHAGAKVEAKYGLTKGECNKKYSGTNKIFKWDKLITAGSCKPDITLVPTIPTGCEDGLCVCKEQITINEQTTNTLKVLDFKEAEIVDKDIKEPKFDEPFFTPWSDIPGSPARGKGALRKVSEKLPTIYGICGDEVVNGFESFDFGAEISASEKLEANTICEDETNKLLETLKESNPEDYERLKDIYKLTPDFEKCGCGANICVDIPLIVIKYAAINDRGRIDEVGVFNLGSGEIELDGMNIDVVNVYQYEDVNKKIEREITGINSLYDNLFNLLNSIGENNYNSVRAQINSILGIMKNYGIDISKFKLDFDRLIGRFTFEHESNAFVNNLVSKLDSTEDVSNLVDNYAVKLKNTKIVDNNLKQTVLDSLKNIDAFNINELITSVRALSTPTQSQVVEFYTLSDKLKPSVNKKLSSLENDKKDVEDVNRADITNLVIDDLFPEKNIKPGLTLSYNAIEEKWSLPLSGVLAGNSEIKIKRPVSTNIRILSSEDIANELEIYSENTVKANAVKNVNDDRAVLARNIEVANVER